MGWLCSSHYLLLLLKPCPDEWVCPSDNALSGQILPGLPVNVVHTTELMNWRVCLTTPVECGTMSMGLTITREERKERKKEKERKKKKKERERERECFRRYVPQYQMCFQTCRPHPRFCGVCPCLTLKVLESHYQ